MNVSGSSDCRHGINDLVDKCQNIPFHRCILNHHHVQPPYYSQVPSARLLLQLCTCETGKPRTHLSNILQQNVKGILIVHCLINETEITMKGHFTLLHALAGTDMGSLSGRESCGYESGPGSAAPRSVVGNTPSIRKNLLR